MYKRISKAPLAEIGAMNGGLNNIAFYRMLQRAIQDCQDRPHEKKPRKVILEVEVTPIVTQAEATNEVELAAKFKSTVPPMASTPVSCNTFHDGDAAWNDMSEDNPKQKTIDEASK